MTMWAREHLSAWRLPQGARGLPAGHSSHGSWRGHMQRGYHSAHHSNSCPVCPLTPEALVHNSQHFPVKSDPLPARS